MKSSLKTRAAILDASGDTPLRDIELPCLNEGDLLVRLLACGVCSGEAMSWYVSRKAQEVLGHEVVGEVLAVGGSSSFAVGDRIFPHHHAPCGACRVCRAGLETNCPSWAESALIPGGYAETFVVPRRHTLKDTLRIPPNMSDEAATFIEPLGCCFRAMRKVRLKADDRVLVVGLGLMGLLNVILFAEHTMVPLIATDFIEERRRMAATLGAKCLFHPADPGAEILVRDFWQGHAADVVVVCPPSAEAVRQALPWLAPGGRLLLFAPPPPDSPVKLDLTPFYFKECELIGSYSAGTEDCRDALSFIARHEPVIQSLVSHTWPLDQVGKALDAIRSHRSDIQKIIVKPQSTSHHEGT